ncbi:hypothetical protein ACF05W_23575 [Streptomyces lydicus]|uniref:hypothetical protein n=1 Tax=Streptomyces lydicus TaxID=47763 RepID=UPI0037034797
MTTVSSERATRCYPGADRPAVDALHLAASFIGSPTMNLEEVRVADDGAQLGGSHLPLPRRADSAYFFSAPTGERLPRA